MSNVSNGSVALSLVDIPEGLFACRLPDSIEAGGFADCELNLTDSAASQVFHKSFTIECSDSARSRFTVPVVRQMLVDSASSGPPDVRTSAGL